MNDLIAATRPFATSHSAGRQSSLGHLKPPAEAAILSRTGRNGLQPAPRRFANGVATDMAKSADDFPDPLQSSAGGADASTDALLSQWAGDEIDKLLSEADAEATSPRASDPAAAVAKEAAVADPPATEVPADAG